MNWNGEFAITYDDNGYELVKDANLDQHLVVDSTKIRKELGFTEIVSSETGLLNAIQWEINHNLL
jgi:nucleoside-diphosphate-sugar epimerase